MTKLRQAGFPASFTVRHHGPGTATIAYNHALAITGDAAIAESIAASAVRRGAQSRLAIIAHSRHQALEHARRSPQSKTDGVADPELLQLAQQLANTRPAIERVIVDLDQRYQLDSTSVARVLGLSASRAETRKATVTKAWAESLDPAVMAWLGPGSCDSLATVLTQARLWPRSSEVPMVSSVDTTGPVPLLSTGTDGMSVETAPETQTTISVVTIDALLTSVPAVRDHASQCDVCATRLEMLTPVRSLLGQVPLAEPPISVTNASRNSFRRLPSALPPSIEPHHIDITRLRVPAFTITALALLVVTAGLMITSHDNKETQADRVAKLVEMPQTSSLLATPTVFSIGTKTAAIANNSSQTLTWNATSNVAWLSFNPPSGQLEPNQSVSIVIKNSEPVENHNNAEVTITGSDGSKQTLQYRSAH